MTRKPRAPRAAVLLALAAAALGGACTNVTGDASHVAAIEFDSLPFPAVVTGDTLRDSLGRAAPLRAVALNTAGGVIPDPEVRYIALDTGITISPSGLVTAQARGGQVRIIASSGALQSISKTLVVARAPDSVRASGATRFTVEYTGVAPVASEALAVRLATRDTVGGVTGTQGWLVSFQAFFRGAAIAPTDTSLAVLLGDGTQRSRVDTTGTDGTASRRVSVRPLGLTQSLTDSIIVLATVRYRGAQVRGSPVRFVILVRPK
ncbi:MAG: hypothetical protein FJ202_05635 [Gemmatimonadetes bacterium]|nr:hypothetical protein [Gemmatimonadota bacterium]